MYITCLITAVGNRWGFQIDSVPSDVRNLFRSNSGKGRY